jgi:hypothetical protein
LLGQGRTPMAKRRRKQVTDAKRGGRRWSQRVTEESAALALEPGVFTLPAPRQIALSLKRSADTSQARKSPPFRSAMSMLNFYINRAGRGLPASRKQVLEKAKDELRALYGKARKA